MSEEVRKCLVCGAQMERKFFIVMAASRETISAILESTNPLHFVTLSSAANLTMAEIGNQRAEREGI